MAIFGYLIWVSWSDNISFILVNGRLPGRYQIRSRGLAATLWLYLAAMVGEECDCCILIMVFLHRDRKNRLQCLWLNVWLFPELLRNKMRLDVYKCKILQDSKNIYSLQHILYIRRIAKWVMKYIHVVKNTFAANIIASSYWFTSTCYVYIYIYSGIHCIALPYLTFKRHSYTPHRTCIPQCLRGYPRRHRRPRSRRRRWRSERCPRHLQPPAG